MKKAIKIIVVVLLILLLLLGLLSYYAANSLRSIVSMFCTLFSGYLFQRFGYRKVVAVGLCCATLSYVIYASMTAYWVLIAGSVVGGIAHGLCSTAGVSRLVNVWFHKYRGTVLGIVAAATGLGSMLLGFVQAWAIEFVSWRMSFAIVAALELGLAVLVYVSVRNYPQDMGLHPFGVGEQVNTKKKVSLWEGFSMKQLKKSPSYYLLILCPYFLPSICVLYIVVW